MYRFLLGTACLLLSIAPLTPQDARGTIVGRVTDLTGANIAGVEVRATSLATGVVASARTNDAGNYSLPYLTPGFYTISSENAGFRKFTRENVQVRVSEIIELNIQMVVGDVAETIDVKADTPVLSTAEA